MSACEKCWGDAYLRSLCNPTKTQAEHYRELLEERKDNPCEQPEPESVVNAFGEPFSYHEL